LQADNAAQASNSTASTVIATDATPTEIAALGLGQKRIIAHLLCEVHRAQGAIIFQS
jgi:hypothetical protein